MSLPLKGNQHIRAYWTHIFGHERDTYVFFAGTNR
jgi:hypothetical protein